ncbi:MAG: hypothetical protein Q9169_003281 [Polycauliona sp. 2 TL-2023]
MKFMTLLAAGILPILALAAPVADANPVAVGEAEAMPVAEPVDVAEPDVPETSPVDARDLFKRATQYCRIIGNDGPVNCRSGPGTSYSVRYTMAPGNGYYFTCYKRGTSVGGNTSWDYSRTYGCYVAGYYTDGNCTPGKFSGPTALSTRD